jgi:hypothetical protein
MQHLDQSSLPLVPTPLLTAAPANEPLQRRPRLASTYTCRSGPRFSRIAAVRQSCASFRLACSLHPAEK